MLLNKLLLNILFYFILIHKLIILSFIIFTNPSYFLNYYIYHEIDLNCLLFSKNEYSADCLYLIF